MSFVEIMVFHLMVHNKAIYIMEYHDMDHTVSGMVLGSAVGQRGHCAAQHADDGIHQKRVRNSTNRHNRDRGRPRGPTPPTPPCVRVRTRRFGSVTRPGQPMEVQAIGSNDLTARC